MTVFEWTGIIFSDMVKSYRSFINVRDAGYGIDKQYPDIFYLPEDARIDLLGQSISWMKDGVILAQAACQSYLYLSLWLQGQNGKTPAYSDMAFDWYRS